MSQFLLRHPAAQFIASSGTCSKLAVDNIANRQRTGVDLEIGGHQTISGEKAEVVALRLAHGANPDICFDSVGNGILRHYLKL
jgi:hypothetical protein